MVKKPYQDFVDKVVELGMQLGYKNKSKIAEATGVNKSLMTRLSTSGASNKFLSDLAAILQTSSEELVRGTRMESVFTARKAAEQVAQQEKPKHQSFNEVCPYDDFVNRLESLGARLGYASLQQISVSAGIGRSTVSAWRSRKPSPGKLQTVANLLKVRPLELVTGTSLEGSFKESEFGKQIQSEPDKYDIGLAISAGTKLYFDGRQLSVEEVTKLRQMLSKRDAQDV